MTYEGVYMHVFEDLYYELYLYKQRNYYNILNVVNLSKILPVLFNNKSITLDNINDFSANFYEHIKENYYFAFCNEESAYNSSYEIVLNKYYSKQSHAFDELVITKPEFKNLLTDIEKELSDYILDLNYMYSILHPASVIYTLADKYSYSEVIERLKNYMIEEGIALHTSNFLKLDFLKENKSIIRRVKPEGQFIDRLKLHGEKLYFWVGAVYYALIENRDMNEMYYRNKLTNTFIDNDIYGDYHIAEFQNPEITNTECQLETDDDDESEV